MPIAYKTFAYVKSELDSTGLLMTQTRCATVNFMFERLGRLQGFDEVKIYYADGQQNVTRVLHDAAKCVLSAKAVL